MSCSAATRQGGGRGAHAAQQSRLALVLDWQKQQLAAEAVLFHRPLPCPLAPTAAPLDSCTYHPTACCLQADEVHKSLSRNTKLSNKLFAFLSSSVAFTKGKPGKGHGERPAKCPLTSLGSLQGGLGLFQHLLAPHSFASWTPTQTACSPTAIRQGWRSCLRCWACRQPPTAAMHRCCP